MTFNNEAQEKKRLYGRVFQALSRSMARFSAFGRINFFSTANEQLQHIEWFLEVVTVVTK